MRTSAEAVTTFGLDRPSAAPRVAGQRGSGVQLTGMPRLFAAQEDESGLVSMPNSSKCSAL